MRCNNRVEQAHQPIRVRERVMWRFKSVPSAQRFLDAFTRVGNLFRPGRHRLTAGTYRATMLARARSGARWPGCAWPDQIQSTLSPRGCPGTSPRGQRDNSASGAGSVERGLQQLPAPPELSDPAPGALRRLAGSHSNHGRPHIPHRLTAQLLVSAPAAHTPSMAQIGAPGVRLTERRGPGIVTWTTAHAVRNGRVRAASARRTDAGGGSAKRGVGETQRCGPSDDALHGGVLRWRTARCGRSASRWARGSRAPWLSH
jgi:hypothetical protein